MTANCGDSEVEQAGVAGRGLIRGAWSEQHR